MQLLCILSYSQIHENLWQFLAISVFVSKYVSVTTYNAFYHGSENRATHQATEIANHAKRGSKRYTSFAHRRKKRKEKKDISYNAHYKFHAASLWGIANVVSVIAKNVRISGDTRNLEIAVAQTGETSWRVIKNKVHRVVCNRRWMYFDRGRSLAGQCAPLEVTAG